MSHKFHLWPEERREEVDGAMTVSVTIESPQQERSVLWYRIFAEHRSLVTHSCDPFVVATIFPAMRHSTEVVVHGEVSPSLLQNLAEFNTAWNCWRPQVYQLLEITADVEREAEQSNSELAVCTFSGGVDSCFTAFRHRASRCGRGRRNLQAGVMVHGYDIPLSQKQVFDRAFTRSKIMLDSLGLELIPVATNFREVISINWEDAYVSAIASALMLFQNRYSIGLLANGASRYNHLLAPHSSNPVTDHFLSSKSFQCVHDGAGANRLQKIQEVLNWPEALQNLRVCWEGAQLDRNCCHCEKCIRTILGFRVMGAALPPCFEQDVTDAQILQLRASNAVKLGELEMIVEAAKAAGIADSWVRVLETSIARNRRQNRRQLAIAGLKTAIKKRLPPVVVKKLEQPFF